MRTRPPRPSKPPAPAIAAAVSEEEWASQLDRFALWRSLQSGQDAVRELALTWEKWAKLHHEAADRLEQPRAITRGRQRHQLGGQVDGLEALFLSACRPGSPILDFGDVSTVTNPGHPWGKMGAVKAVKLLDEANARGQEKERLNGLYERIYWPARGYLLNQQASVPELVMKSSELRARARAFEHAVEVALGMLEAIQQSRNSGGGDGGRTPLVAVKLLLDWAQDHGVTAADLAKQLVAVGQFPDQMPEQLAVTHIKQLLVARGESPQSATRMATEQVFWGRRYVALPVDHAPPWTTAEAEIKFARDTWRKRLNQGRDQARRKAVRKHSPGGAVT